MSAGLRYRHCRLDRSQNLSRLVKAHDFLHHDGVEGRRQLADGRITGTDTDILNCRLLPTDTQPTEGCIEVLRETCAVNCGSQDAFEGRVLPLTRKVGDVVRDIRASCTIETGPDGPQSKRYRYNTRRMEASAQSPRNPSPNGSAEPRPSSDSRIRETIQPSIIMTVARYQSSVPVARYTICRAAHLRIDLNIWKN